MGMVQVRKFLGDDVPPPSTEYKTEDMFSNGVIIGWKLHNKDAMDETIQFCVLRSPSGFGCISPSFLDIVEKRRPSPNSAARLEGFIQGVTADFLDQAQQLGEVVWIPMCSDAMLSVDFRMWDLFWRMVSFTPAPPDPLEPISVSSFGRPAH
jgi:hypothetical protein